MQNNKFIEEFKDALYDTMIAYMKGIVDNDLKAKNEEKWITIKGNHILLKEGESIADAFKRTTGKSLYTKESKEYTPKHKPSKAYSEILDRVKSDNNKNITPEEIINTAIKSLKFSEEEIRNKINFADSYNDGVTTTFTKYRKNGQWTNSRKEEHKRIIQKLFANKDKAKPKAGEDPTFIVLGGRGGSGKGNFGRKGNAAQVYDHDNYIILDADAIKDELKEYKGYNAFEVHEESSYIMKRALIKAKKEGLNVVWDGTLKTLKSAEEKIKDFKDSGYNIEMYYMHLPREKAATRAVGRFMEKEGGRYVPLAELLKMKDNEENFDKLKKYASKWAFYNNDVEFGKDPILVDKNY